MILSGRGVGAALRGLMWVVRHLVGAGHRACWVGQGRVVINPQHIEGEALG